MAVIFPDIELWACKAIQAGLSNLYTPAPYVGVQVPDTRPAMFVTVRRDGGEVEDFVLERPRLSVNCWADTEYKCGLLARQVSAILRGASSAATETVNGAPVHVGFVSGIQQIGGPSAVPDAQHRKLSTFQLTVRGVEL